VGERGREGKRKGGREKERGTHAIMDGRREGVRERKIVRARERQRRRERERETADEMG